MKKLYKIVFTFASTYLDAVHPNKCKCQVRIGIEVEEKLHQPIRPRNASVNAPPKIYIPEVTFDNHTRAP